MLFYFTILKPYFINIPYHFTIPLHRKTLFLLKYYFLTHSLLFLPTQPFSLIFLGFSTTIFISPSQHRFNTQHTPSIHRSTIQTHHHTPTHTNTYINPATKPHTNTTQQQSQATHKHKPIQKPGHRSKTQAKPPIHAADQPNHAADLKPRPPIKNWSKPIQKNHHRSKLIQTHSKKKSSPEQTHSNPFKKHHHRSHGANPFNKIITGAIGANPFKKMREMREQRRERRWRAETREQTH